MRLQRHYTQDIAKVSFALLGFVVGAFFGIAVFNQRVAFRMEMLANVIASGHQKLMITSVRTTLAHMAEMLRDSKMTPEVCRDFAMTMQESGGFYAVLAVGNMDGEAVCTSDEAVATPLPTMQDRLYYERAKDAKGLVVGEYAISKTTGKPTLHYAYPVFDSNDARVGFVMAAVDLNWFVNSTTSNLFSESGVEIVGADRNGRVLFMYPADKQMLGKNSLSSRLIATILRGEKSHVIAQSYTGEYRMYAYQWSNETDNDLVIMASVGLVEYWYFWFASGALGASFAWIVAERLLQARAR